MAVIDTARAAIYLGIYATVVSTAAGLWALFSGIVRDRARITVRAVEAYIVTSTQGQILVEGEDTLETMGVTPRQRIPVLKIVVRNRGRRDAQVENVSQTRRGTGGYVFGDLANQVPFDLPAEHSKTLVLGAQGGYQHGTIPTRRFYVVDGADRVHPLRQRYRRRAARIAYAWILERLTKRRRKALRNSGQ
jgi:hypothetical protein